MSDKDKYLDFWNFMAYDYSGSWDTPLPAMTPISNLLPTVLVLLTLNFI